MPPAVSVVIPVYNAGPYLEECLASIAAQTIGFDAIEVVAVDDGSTDGSGAKLDEWAARHPNVRVLHQANSGAPGAPRNRGIEASTGAYLFFADPDDYLGPEAFARMLEMARRNESDIVLGRIKGVGRVAPTLPFERSVDRGDVVSTEALWSLTAHKLFRRSLIVDNGLRFAEGVRLAEEQPLVVPAYFLAKVISVVADYDCYYLVRRPDFLHLTHELPDPEQLSAMVCGSVRIVNRHTAPGPERDRLLARWGDVEILPRFGHRFLDMAEPVREAYTRYFSTVVAEYLPPSVFAGMPAIKRVRAELIRRGRTDELVRLARFERSGERGPAVVEGDRVYAGYPHFRDPAYGIPDECYDIAGQLALDHCRVEATGTADGELRVRWHPGVPALRDPALSWSLLLRGPGGEERRYEAAGTAVTVDLSDLPDGRWVAHTQVTDGERQETLAVGEQGTAAQHPGLVPGSARDRPVVPSLTDGVLAVTVVNAGRRRAETVGVRWARGRLSLTIVAPWPFPGEPTLYLTRGEGGPEVAVPAVQRPDEAAPGVTVRAELDLRALARAGLASGRWQCAIGRDGAPPDWRVPVRAAATCDGLGPPPTRTPIGAPLWSLAWVRAIGRGRALTLVIADWRDIARRVRLRGGRAIGRVLARP